VGMRNAEKGQKLEIESWKKGFRCRVSGVREQNT
jgi:hypothetical protein